MSYTHFTLEERKYLQQLLSENKSFRQIAAILERSPSTVSREANRNKSSYKPRKSDNKFWYNHWRAQNLYIRRRREQKRRALVAGSKQWNYVAEKLKLFGHLSKLSIAICLNTKKNSFLFQQFTDIFIARNWKSPFEVFWGVALA